MVFVGVGASLSVLFRFLTERLFFRDLVEPLALALIILEYFPNSLCFFDFLTRLDGEDERAVFNSSIFCCFRNDFVLLIFWIRSGWRIEEELPR